MNIDPYRTYTTGSYSFVNFSQLDEKSIESVREWRNDLSVRRFMYNSNEITKEEHKNFIKSLSSREDRCYWLVYLNGVPLGVVNIVDINPEKRCGEIGYYLIPSQQDSGKGLDFLFAVYHFMFCTIGCDFLFGRTEIHNINAMALNYYLGVESSENIVTIDGADYIEFVFRKNAFMEAFDNRTDTVRLVSFLKDIKKRLKLKYKDR